MIRIKCPKCSTPLQLDDDQAGEVGVCDDCGAKFRVPAAKAAAPARPRKNDEVKRAPAKRRRDEEDDEEDESPRKRSSSRKSAKANDDSAAMAATIQLGITLAVCVVVFGLGAIFIRNLGWIVVGVGGLVVLAALLLLVKKAINGGMADAAREGVLTVGFLLMCGAGYLGTTMNDSSLEAQRKATRKQLDEPLPAADGKNNG